jgi:hypothetical protein
MGNSSQEDLLLRAEVVVSVLDPAGEEHRACLIDRVGTGSSQRLRDPQDLVMVMRQ